MDAGPHDVGEYVLFAGRLFRASDLLGRLDLARELGEGSLWTNPDYYPDVPHDTFDPLSDPLNDPFPEEFR